MKHLLLLLLLTFSFSAFGQPFSMSFRLDETANTLSLVLVNNGPDYSYTQVQDINAFVTSGASSILTVASTDFDLVINPGGFLNLGAAFNSTGTIMANETLVLGVLNLSPGPHNLGDFVIFPGVFPPTQRATFGTDNSTEFPVVSGTLLPITITSFTATKLSEYSARLAWETSSEINSDYFAVQRSQDLQEWTTLGSVKAAGQSAELLAYQYDDLSIPRNLRSGNGTFYYRLVAVDIDEQYDISEVRTLSFNPASDVITIYPNPTNREVVVDLSSIEGGATIQVFDLAGKLVYSQLISDEYNNIPVLDLKANGLQNGAYILRIEETLSAAVHNKRVLLID